MPIMLSLINPLWKELNPQETRTRTDISSFMTPVVVGDNDIKAGTISAEHASYNPNNVTGQNRSESLWNVWNREEQEDNLETNPSSENIIKSNNLTVRITKAQTEETQIIDGGLHFATDVEVKGVEVEGDPEKAC